MTVCVSDRRRLLQPAPAGGDQGWIVFSDSNGNQVVDVNDPIRRVQPALPAATRWTAAASPL